MPLRAFHWQCVDDSVVVANRSEEQIRQFFEHMKGGLTS
jgi:hypothetical protein